MISFKSLRQALLMSVATFGGAAAVAAAVQPAYAQEVTRTYNIRAQDLNSALREFAMQTGRDVLYPPEIVAGKRSPGVQGQLTDRQALEALLAGTGLQFEQTASNGYAVQDPNSPTRLGDARDATPSETDDGATAEILVTGRRTLNADIRRTEDDTQPYVVFTGEDLARSGVNSVEEFLASRLPMNTQSQTTPTLDFGSSLEGRINLRGLGTSQTLVLVDGRRIPDVGVVSGGGFGQPMISGIAPSMIERIEVLPATASGIYGGGATGGVINIILKRDYSGLDVLATHGNTFDTDVGSAELTLSGGFMLPDGETRVTFSAAHALQNDLLAGDRDFSRRSRELLWQNDPTAFSFPVDAYTGNVCSAVGTSTSCSTSAAPLVLDNGTLLNSRFTYVPVGYAGPASDNGAAFVANAGAQNFDARANAGPYVAASETQSLSFSLRRPVFDNRADVFLAASSDTNVFESDGPGLTTTSARTINLPASDPANPFQQNIAISVPMPSLRSRAERETELLRANVGVNVRLSSDWAAGAEYSWSRTSTTLTRPNLVGPLSAAATAHLRSIALRDTNAFPADTTLFDTSRVQEVGPFETTLGDAILRFTGAPLSLPAGPVTLTGYIEQREVRLADTFSSSNQGTSPTTIWYPEKAQDIRSAYLEARVPVLSEENALPFARELEFMASVRHDEYQTETITGGTLSISVPSPSGPFPPVTHIANEVESTDYTVGLRFVPFPGIAVRASFGTGFLPPDLSQISPLTIDDFASSLGIDPRRGGTPMVTPFDVVAGGGPDLEPEQSESLSVGVILTPRFAPGLRVSVDYTQIEKTDEIFTPGFQYFLDNESLFPGRIVRGPNLPGDAPGWAGPITLFNVAAVNVAQTEVEAYDFQIDYEIETQQFGTWRPYILATYQTVFTRHLPGPAGPVNAVGLANGPLEWRGNFGLNWTGGPWTVGWNAQYVDSYSVCGSTNSAAACAQQSLRQGADSIPTQIYQDAYISYSFDRNAGTIGTILANTELTLGVNNMFDEEPATRWNTGALGQYSSYGDPRLRRFSLTLRKHFGE